MTHEADVIGDGAHFAQLDNATPRLPTEGVRRYQGLHLPAVYPGQRAHSLLRLDLCRRALAVVLGLLDGVVHLVVHAAVRIGYLHPPHLLVLVQGDGVRVPVEMRDNYVRLSRLPCERRYPSSYPPGPVPWSGSGA